jgi:hypothetical protein
MLLAGGLAAEAALVQPIYQVSSFTNFGPVIGTPLVSNFGSGIYCAGTLTTTVRKALVPIDLNGDTKPEIWTGDLTFIYTLKAASTNTLDYLQVALARSMKDVLLMAAGYKTAVPNIPLLRLNTEVDTYSFQLEFGNQSSGTPDYRLRLAPGKTLEMFVTFHNVDVPLTHPTALVKGTKLATSGIPTLGAIPQPEPSSILLVLSGLGAVVGVIIRKRR